MNRGSSPYLTMTSTERLFFIAFSGMLLIFSILGSMILGGGISIATFGFFSYIICLTLPFILPGFKPSFFHPVVFYIIMVGYRGVLEGDMALSVFGLDYHRALGTLNDISSQNLLSKYFLLETFSFLCLILGFVFGRKIRFKSLSAPDFKNLSKVSFFWLLVCLMAYLVMVVEAGGVAPLLMQRGISQDERIVSDIGSHWNFLIKFGPIIPLIWLACHDRAFKNPLFWAILFTALCIKFASTGSRGGLVWPLLMLGTVWALQNKRLPRFGILVWLMTALLLVGFLGEFRSATSQSAEFQNVQVDGTLKEWVGKALEEIYFQKATNNGELAVLGAVPEQSPYLMGESYKSILYIPFPSAIVGSKPPAGGALLSEHIYGRPLNTIPPQPVGEAYWNFSVAGVVVVFILFGFALGLLSSFYQHNPKHPMVLVLYVVALFAMRPSSDALYSLFQQIVPVLLIYLSFCIRLKKRHLIRGVR